MATSFGNSSFGPRAKKTVASSRAPQAPTCGEEARARGPHSFAAKTPRRGPELRKPRASACCEDGPRASSFGPWGKPSAHGSAAPPNFAHEVRPSAAAQVRPSAAARASTHARRRPWPAPARLKLRPAAKRPVRGKRRVEKISILTATHQGSSVYAIWFRHTCLWAPSTKIFSFGINSTNHEASILGFKLKFLANHVIWLGEPVSRLREVFINLVFNPRFRCADWAGWSSFSSRAVHAPSGDHEGPTHGLQVSRFWY